MNIRHKQAFLLGVESSCDDTAAAVIKGNKILANVVADQSVHKAYGGVVPELASRAHQQNIVPVVDQALLKAGITKHDLSAIAFTQGPGLLGSLLVGSSFSKAFALALDIPLIDVHHMQAHVLAHFIEDERNKDHLPEFPFLCLTVSGGHTQLVRVDAPLEMEVVGSTLDDAAGEAFDKAAKILGLPYPGGPLIDKYAQAGDPGAYTFPEPKVKGYDFSFSGLKTAFLYFIQERTQKDPDFVQNNLADICASIQYTIITLLLQKLKRASRELNIPSIALAGGVSANSELRRRFRELGEKLDKDVFIPPFEYCTDNAAMIAMAGQFKYQERAFAGQDVVARARMTF